MKVEELIKKLRTFSPEDEVLIWGVDAYNQVDVISAEPVDARSKAWPKGADCMHVALIVPIA